MLFLNFLISVALSRELCDETRVKCCAYHDKYGMVPYVKWANTPESEKKWYEDNNCNSVMGGSSLSQCPYTCSVECDDFQGGACDMDHNEALISLIQNRDTCSEEECKSKCRPAAEEYGTGCCQWGWLMQDIEGKSCYYFKGVGDDGYGTRYWMQREHSRQVCTSYAVVESELEDEGSLAMTTSENHSPMFTLAVKALACVGFAVTVYGAGKFYLKK